MTETHCGEAFHRCRCALPPGHTDPAHACIPECGGSWRPDPASVADDVLMAELAASAAPGSPPPGPVADHGVIIESFPRGIDTGTTHPDAGNPYDPDTARGAPYDPLGASRVFLSREPIRFYAPPSSSWDGD